jgi:transcriptional regulator with XRE-family HTH domain
MEAARVHGELETRSPLGARIKHLRLLHALSLKELSIKAQCSESMLSKIEHGRINPSINLLHRVAQAMGVAIADLFDERGATESFILRQGHRPLLGTNELRSGEGITLESLCPSGRNRLLQGNLHVLEVGARSDGLIEHVGEEVGFVLEGSLELTVGDQTGVLEAGDSFYFDSTRPHGYRNVGDDICKVVWINTPPTY